MALNGWFFDVLEATRRSGTHQVWHRHGYLKLNARKCHDLLVSLTCLSVYCLFRGYVAKVAPDALSIRFSVRILYFYYCSHLFLMQNMSTQKQWWHFWLWATALVQSQLALVDLRMLGSAHLSGSISDTIKNAVLCRWVWQKCYARFYRVSPEHVG